MPSPSPAPTPTVSAIFERAERVFERRVDQLLHHKRTKARSAGTPFNARKAKRDARTVAGREKLDALVRRLADLASVQEAALGHDQSSYIQAGLDGAAAAVVGAAALAAATLAANRASIEDEALPEGACELPDPPCLALHAPHSDLLTCAAHAAQAAPRQVGEERDAVKDMLDTSSCSDDGCSVAGCLLNTKDPRESVESDPGLRDPSTPAVLATTLHHDEEQTCDRDLFPATESVVNFVLECDDDTGCLVPTGQEGLNLTATNDRTGLNRCIQPPSNGRILHTDPLQCGAFPMRHTFGIEKHQLMTSAPAKTNDWLPQEHSSRPLNSS